ncbi:MAG: exonuclease of the beta-lactamase fold involved in processing-like protein [Gemmatimonadetes bacterium]|nr:exonuclease of the beta-lactamase fold involved in processing-like protein [Gemmatimonadota bacterium]
MDSKPQGLGAGVKGIGKLCGAPWARRLIWGCRKAFSSNRAEGATYRPENLRPDSVTTLLRLGDRGLYCEVGDFHIDPWQPVERAVITHAHGDHARWGSGTYLCSREGQGVLRTRLGTDASIQSVDWAEPVDINGVRVSLHPAGHILGSAQIRVEHRGEVWVASGDYKTDPDPTCTPFELVRCHTFITESTFGLPIYRWCPEWQVFDDIRAWWTANRHAGRASVLFGYALGKAQRLLAGLAGADIGPIYTHGAVERLNRDYRAAGVRLADTRYASDLPKGYDFSGSMIVAPPSAAGSTWLRRFGNVSTGFASGWMRIRGARRRRALDRGFVLSDHVDWPSLLAAVEGTGAQRVWVTHGTREPLVRWLTERGLEAMALRAQWKGEEDADPVEVAGEEIPA